MYRFDQKPPQDIADLTSSCVAELSLVKKRGRSRRRLRAHADPPTRARRRDDETAVVPPHRRRNLRLKGDRYRTFL